MKEKLSLFLLKNSLGSKMRKGYRGFCSGDGSTSILNQRKANCAVDTCMATKSLASSGGTPPTLEEMILQLEIEERMARNARKQEEDEYGEVRRRMSCVNNSDILRTARNALNQYPRFSLDGKDAMYRSSFRNLPPISSGGGIRKGFNGVGLDSGLEKTLYLPSMLGGESVVWCKPGVVAKLMGLEAVPVPVRGNCRKEKLSSDIKKQNLRKRVEKHEMERRKLVMDINGGWEINRGRGMMGSCSTTGSCVMKPIKIKPANDGVGWPMRRFG